MKMTSRPSGPLIGETTVPGDKSISHRALLLSALASGDSHLEHMLMEGDCSATVGMLGALGVRVEEQGSKIVVHGRGLHGLTPPKGPINCLRSGTTMRLGAGVLAAQSFTSVLNGDPQLLKRPMRRITEPLACMGARIICKPEGTPPLEIEGTVLSGYEHYLNVASAQVKSCLLLAGLYAKGETIVVEPGPSRDHTERMLRARGVNLQSENLHHILRGPIEGLLSMDMTIPGDISSASYLIAAATLVPGSKVRIQGVGVNPTRTGLIDVLNAMGAHIALENIHDAGGEPVGDIVVEHALLHGIEVSGSIVPRMIDELPVLALAAACAQGSTIVRDAAELRHKESDRIDTVSRELTALGAQIQPTEDGFIIEGVGQLQGATVQSYGDHRLAMTLAIAGLVAHGETTIHDAECIPDSFPGFSEILDRLGEINV